MDRQIATDRAIEAASRARALADEAESWARTYGEGHRATPLAAAGALWADTARAYTTLATVLPEPPATTDTETEKASA